MKPLELYIHIPFCVRKCAYCDFLSAPASREVRERYITALRAEIASQSPVFFEVSSVFFGGGTPSLMPPEVIGAVFNDCRRQFAFADDVEITMEANPGTVTPETLRGYRAAGVNRLSFGLQSADNEELKLLGRIHTWEEFLANYEAAREAGFANINVDLMSGLPGQTLESWEKSLRAVASLSPEHISAYSLIIEEGTPFYERYAEDEARRDRGDEPLVLPSEETERRMYVRTGEILAEYGFSRYEISNYAREGLSCRHNEGYWTGVDYLGFGLGASSFMDGVRFRNTDVLADYLECSHDGTRRVAERSVLTAEERQEEFFFLGLRRMAGVRRADYRRFFGEDWEARYGDAIRRLCAEGLLSLEADVLKLTQKGVHVSNLVFAELLA